MPCPLLTYEKEVREIFRDRLCDGISDCPRGQDETGKMGTCKKPQLTKKGCCDTIVGTHQYVDYCTADVCSV